MVRGSYEHTICNLKYCMLKMFDKVYKSINTQSKYHVFLHLDIPTGQEVI